jgi:hypothetical protein
VVLAEAAVVGAAAVQVAQELLHLFKDLMVVLAVMVAMAQAAVAEALVLLVSQVQATVAMVLMAVMV